MSPDELIYLGLLVLSIPLGGLVRQVREPTWRRAVVFAVGAGQVLLTCRWDTLHSLVTILGTFTILKTAGPRTCHLLTFVWCFGYLAFFRTCHLFHLPSPAAVANAVQLVLTLKLSSVAFDIRDSHLAEKSRKDGNDNSADGGAAQEGTRHKTAEQEFLPVPSLIDLFCYSYCYIGVYTGPFYKYKTYHDFIHQERPSSIPVIQPLLDRAKWMPLTGGVFLLASRYFPIAYAHTEEFYASSGVPYRLWYMLGMFLVFRMRMYSAWILAECSCITAGLGAYEEWRKPKCGQGPTIKGMPKPEDKSPQETRYNFDTTKNVDIYWVELGTTIRSGMKYWNMTVQYWMAEYIYRRVPHKTFRVATTMLLSAYWHGFHPGYYLSLMTIPLSLWVETEASTTFRTRLGIHGQRIWDWLHCVLKMRAYDYMSVGFLLLSFEATTKYWHSICYIYYVFCAVVLALSYCCKQNGLGHMHNASRNDTAVKKMSM
ncbi:lysophospholipid acyltransferase 7-like isoform X1 [Branchiostoma lanceolatum]|uniref:lysophospholipid acyltransferase 7-like isoform X1 n=1 Tax=Branchiostoma lanceolatum TaxID=7740 RepID=UPI003452D759